MEKILIRGVNWVGDVVMTTPFFKGLKKVWPETEIYVLTRPHLKSLYANAPHIAGIVEIEEKSRLFGWPKCLRQIRQLAPECAICLPHSISSALFLTLSGISQTYGRSCHYRSVLFTHPVYGTIEDYSGHQVDFYLEMLEAITGSSDRDVLPEIYLSEADLKEASDIIRNMKLPLLGLCTTAAYGPAKLWPKEYFIEIAKRFINDTGGSVLLFGSASDSQYTETTKSSIGKHAYNLAGRTSLLVSTAIMRACQVVVANDSGPMHLAAASGTRTIGIFGSTDPKRTAPRGKQASYLYKAKTCSPCYERTCRYEMYECLRCISPEEVYERIQI
ncbi:MAG: lipopolysaccharide heptosyltransferase II [Deltaproteobacteria bacterium]|nr:lipopolysaccharide heptosyltransferase II [Deltaproteobacteria bacterium]